MELVFETVELAAFSDKPVGAYYSMNDINWVYASLAKREGEFGGFFLLNLNAGDEDIPHMAANKCGSELAITTLKADVWDDLLVLYGDLKFVVPDDRQDIIELLRTKPWRVLLNEENSKYDDVMKKLVEKKWVSGYFVEQIDVKDFR